MVTRFDLENQGIEQKKLRALERIATALESIADATKIGGGLHRGTPSKGGMMPPRRDEAD
jgi:hypothetical protein